ncbi:FAD-dependent oxidoreductase [bacterium]|nr:FAD-dependent oxidoreductase [bacterium]
MTEFTININDQTIQTSEDKTLLQAALDAGIYIPHLCYHSDLPFAHGMKPDEFVYDGPDKIIGDNPGFEFEGCKLCLVEIDGAPDPVLSCNTKAAPGMIIKTHTDNLVELRMQNLIPILNDHPHACLTCAQIEGCSREPCSANVPMPERCCPLLGRCELQKVAQYVGIHPMTKRYIPVTQLTHKDHNPFIDISTYLCIGCLRCVRVCHTLKGVEALGFTVKNNKIITGYVTKDDILSNCKFCGSCVEVCPTGALIDRGITYKDREKQLIPCKTACPAGINVPLYIECISRGEFDKARNVVREQVPFPNVLGKVCFHPCEEACRRAELSDPISICALKDAVFQEDEDLELLLPEPTSTGKRIAVIGAGPCGLTAGYYLSRKGHEVTVFDANEEPGGMLRYGIPEYRLPREILKKDIDFITSSGLKIETGQEIGKNLTLSALQNKGFDAIFIATGAWSNKKIIIEGIDLSGVDYGVDLLIKRSKGLLEGDYFKDKDVVIIGGGNVAIDTARTAIRLKAKSVKLICLEQPDEMPAYPWEIEEAKEEGIEMMNGWGPLKINGNDGFVSSITLKKCTRVFDESGNFNPKYDDSVTTNVTTNVVIISIGQVQNPDFAKDIHGLNIANNGIISVNKDTLSTSAKAIYAGGDAVTIPASVIEAIESGRKAAISIDKYLGGDGDISERLIIREDFGLYIGKTENFKDLKRIPQNAIRGEDRRASFTSFLYPYVAEEAVKEAERCFKCHQRFRIHSVIFPPEQWFHFDQDNIGEVPEKAGVYRLLDAEKKVIFVCGTQKLHHALEQDLLTKEDAAFFDYEEDEMYTKRESELIQQFLQQHGSMPRYNADLDDDLF